MKSTSGCVIYYRACPIAWKPCRQSVRTNSTFESEFVAASDTLVLRESLDFRGFFGEDTDDTLWCDNQTAVTVAKTPAGSERPKSRHVALRYMKVTEFADKIQFCPTEHQKADVLTKCSVGSDVRNNAFYHNPHMKNARKKREKYDECDMETDSMFVLWDEAPCCFLSVAEYLLE